MVQRDLEQIADEAAAEVMRVHEEASKRKQPLYVARRSAIASVRGFWRDSFLGHPLLAALITQRDAEVLEHLIDLDVVEGDESGYKSTMSFERNPYLANEKLEIGLEWAEDGILTVTTTEIEWKPGYDPQAAAAAEAGRDGGGGDGGGGGGGGGGGSGKRSFEQSGGMARSDQLPVFLLTLLTVPPQGEPGDAKEGGDDEDEGAVEAVCEAIKDEVWSNPLQYYQAADVERAAGSP